MDSYAGTSGEVRREKGRGWFDSARHVILRN